jgi:hypothetical protein
MFPGDLRQRLPRTAVANDLLTINVEWSTANPSSFQFRSTHASPDALDNQTSFEFGNRSNDYRQSFAKRSGSIDVLAETNEFDAQVIQFIEHFQKMPHASGHSVECSNEHNIEFVPPSIGHKLVEARALGFRAANDIAIFAHDFISALSCHCAQIIKLRLGMLVCCAYTSIDGRSFGGLALRSRFQLGW